jgi:hypothetical protein
MPRPIVQCIVTTTAYCILAVETARLGQSAQLAQDAQAATSAAAAAANSD